jgi:serine/threonine protein phosphatase PrpC
MFNAAAMHLSVASFDTGAATHVGKVRTRNEDGYLVLPDAGLWAVADGMGGLEAGDLASRTVIDGLRSIKRPSSAAELLAWCEQRVVAANRVLNEIGQRRGSIIGTTIAVLLAYDSRFACVWSGDSRIYLVRGGAIIQQSRDHTEVQELVAEGKLKPDEARRWPRRNVITRAIGIQDDPELEMRDGVLQAGDAFVLCSDGLTAHVDESEILGEVMARAPQQACDALIDLTLARGAADNVTVLVTRYQPNGDGSAGERNIWE